MEHEMKLDPEPFNWIREGKKKIELRLYDRKRQKIELGDVIIFRNRETGEELRARVKGLLIFESFRDLFEIVPRELLNHQGLSIEEQVARMRKYYSEAEERRCGVVGIVIEKL